MVLQSGPSTSTWTVRPGLRQVKALHRGGVPLELVAEDAEVVGDVLGHMGGRKEVTRTLGYESLWVGDLGEVFGGYLICTMSLLIPILLQGSPVKSAEKEV